MDLKKHLFEPMEEAKTLVMEALRAYGHELTAENLKPSAADLQEFSRSPQNNFTLCKMLSFLSYKQSNYVFLDSDSPLESALVAEIDIFEQRCRHQLSPDLLNVKYNISESVDIQSGGVAKCLFARLLELELAMQKIYKEIKDEAKKKAKKDRKKERKASQQEANVVPENRGEARLDKEEVETQQEQDAVIKGLPNIKQDTYEECSRSKKTFIPKTDLMKYFPEESTKYNSCIFKGKLAIPIPTDTKKELIPIMYFKMENATYEMSGSWWAKFSLEHPSEYILSVYGVGETVDGEYFIACETLEQPLKTWLEDHKHFNHEDRLLSTLKSYFRDVINGAAYVHNRSEGLLEAELSIDNVYIVNGRAKLGFLRQTTLQNDVTAGFRNMVNQVYQNIPIPVEIEHLLKHMHKYSKSSWHPTCATHPMFLSASQKCIYAKIAHDRVEASSSIGTVKNMIDNIVDTNVKPGIGNVKWIRNVKHATLLDVLKYKKKKEKSEEGMKEKEGVKELVEQEVRVEEEIEVGAEIKIEDLDYADKASSFLAFCRNLIVHMKRGALTNEEILFEIDNVIPNFLLCVHEALTICHIYITVGPDLADEEKKGRQSGKPRMSRTIS